MIRRKTLGAVVLIIAGVMMIGGCSLNTIISKAGEYKKMNEEPEFECVEDETRSTAELAEIMKELGIKGITDDVVASIDKTRSEMEEGTVYSVTGSMLSYAGQADYDFDTFTMTPKNDTVYSFDMEVFDIASMYTDFLNGVKSIGHGELDFTNIKEDYNELTGKKRVTFDWDGESYKISASGDSDWFDMKAWEQLNKIIEEKRPGKRVYATTDSYQEIILFYRDAEWAEKFEKEIGKKLY
ncbi:hypothetical protein SAMN06296386_10573 [Lachnospiraceae bacterium]|nr:hypothetical protein SAMN06296386_10573 [Lachnospiraceae bacterium]